MRVDSNPYQPSPLASSTALTQRWPIRTLFALALGLPLTLDFAVLLATGTTGHFIWLFQQAAPLLVVAWPISIPIAIWICVAYKVALDVDELNNRRLLWLTPLLVIPISTLVWGAVFEHPRGHGYVRWQLTVVHWAFFASIAIGILAVGFNRGRRSFVAASALMLLLFSFSCSFIAGSSVTGDWL
jgi:hypothetical protein